MKYIHLRLFKAGLLCFASLVITVGGYAQTKTVVSVTPVGEPASKVGFISAPAIIDNFFKKYKETGSDAAIDYLFGTNKYFNNPTGASQLKARLDSMRASLGEYISKELITQKSASPSLILYSYLVKHEVQPVRFTFIFYKPHNDWVFYRFLFDDQMDLEMEEGAKIGNKHL